MRHIARLTLSSVFAVSAASLGAQQPGTPPAPPANMLASSLASCTFSVLSSWATHTKQSADDLVIEVRWTFSDDEPHRVSELALTYAWPSLPPKKAEAARRVAHMCTVHETLLTPPCISIDAMASDVDATADAAEGAAHVPVADHQHA